MIYPKFVISVLTNDHKAEEGGTHFNIEYNLNSEGTGNLVYSIVDEVNKTSAYKRYCFLMEIFLKEREQYDHFLKTKSESNNKEIINKRLKDNKLSEPVLNNIQTKLCNYADLISEYKSGKEKALNSIVGRILKQLKEESINIDPLVLKETILCKIVN